MPLLGQPFGEDVSDVVLSADVAEGDCLCADLLPDEVVLDVDVLGAGTVISVLGKMDGALIVTE